MQKQNHMMMLSVARVKFLKTKVFFRYHIKGVSKQVSSNSDHEIKSYSCPNSSTKMGEKTWKSGTNISGLLNGAIRGLQIQARKISNRGSFRDFKSGERDFKLRQILKIGVRWISNWDRNYESGKGLQFGAEQARMSRDTVIYLLQSLGIVINI